MRKLLQMQISSKGLMNMDLCLTRHWYSATSDQWTLRRWSCFWMCWIGGKVVIIGSVPGRDPFLQECEANDNTVKNIFDDLPINPDRVFRVDEPENQEELLSWTEGILGKLKIDKDLEIDEPCKDLFQIRNTDGERDIWFIVNSNRSETKKSMLNFPQGN
jgi:hypothetical protein